jgi:hypothetical protein
MLSVEDELLETAHNRAFSIDGGPMWFSGLIGMLAIREKLRIPDENVGVWSVFMFRAPKVVAPTYVD